jgi:hypothetical protein
MREIDEKFVFVESFSTPQYLSWFKKPRAAIFFEHLLQVFIRSSIRNLKLSYYSTNLDYKMPLSNIIQMRFLLTKQLLTKIAYHKRTLEFFRIVSITIFIVVALFTIAYPSGGAAGMLGCWGSSLA